MPLSTILGGPSNLVALAVVLPLLTAVVALFAGGGPRRQRLISLLGASLLLLDGLALVGWVLGHGVLALQVGSWPAPFGITLAADLAGSLMVAVTGLMAVLVLVSARSGLDEARERHGFHPLFHILLMGVSGAFLTGDLFNLYVWFEVMLMASFVLLALGGERGQLEAAVKYVTLNLVASAIFLTTAGLLYGAVGTLNMADLANLSLRGPSPALSATLATLLLVAFGIKAAIFPLFFWLPASYHTPPVAVTTIFSALLTKVGIFALLRVFTLVFASQHEVLRPALVALAAATMLTGVLGAMAQYDIRRLLSFHIVSQIGYLLMGIALSSRLALAGLVYFLVHVILAKSALFLIGGLCHSFFGTYDLRKMGALYKHRPAISVLFLLSALSLAGVPPSSGFFAKLALVGAGLESGDRVLVATALGVSLLTLFSMIKIWTEAFWKAAPASTQEPAAERHAPVSAWAPIAVLASLSLALGLFAGPAFRLSLKAADQLRDRAGYVHAVLGR